MAGNGGTLAAEIVEDLPEAKNFIAPVGGGGLSAGPGALCKRKSASGARVIGCQLEVTPALRLSLDRGSAVTRMSSGESLAAGIEGGIGSLTFDVLRTRVDDTPIVNDAEICDAVRWMVDEHQYLIEPTAAATLAACLSGKVAPLQRAGRRSDFRPQREQRDSAENPMSMKIAQREEILKVLSLKDVIPLMREALVAQSRGECETPMPMHLYRARPRCRSASQIQLSRRRRIFRGQNCGRLPAQCRNRPADI